MKSKITIDVDHDNQPVIKIEYVTSEDVRDKLVKKFLETFGGSSCWAEFYFVNDAQNMSHAVHGQNNSTALVRPITIHELETVHKEKILYQIEENKKLTASKG